MEESPNDGPRVKVSVFDDSIENHFRAMDTISKLCEEPKNDDLDETDVQRFSSSITFLREWRHFNYEPRTMRFANELEDSQLKDVSGGIELPQFSSSTVSKDGVSESNASAEFCKDFVMYVGGSVWALDWCPQVHQNPNSLVKCEFIAIAAHPPESYYHKLGDPLIGRGIIQVWCVLNVRVNEEEVPVSKKKPKQKHQNREVLDLSFPKRPRGRPRKEPIDEPQPDKVKRPKRRPKKKSFGESPNSDPNVQPLAVHYPEDSMQLVSVDDVPGNTQENVPDKNHRKKRKGLKKAAGASVATPETSRNSVKSKRKTQEKNNSDAEGSMQIVSVDNVPGNTQENVPDKNPHKKQKGLKKAACTSVATSETSMMSVKSESKKQEKTNSDAKIQNEESESPSAVNQQIHPNSGQDATAPENVLGFNSFKVSPGSSSIPAEVVLPRAVLCLAHNGKVVWDVKWQPNHINDSKCNQRMGYLAVLLGNGSLEVWEVPLPNMIKNIYSSSPKQGTDPRFVKLEPVFSIPLTVEWSTSPPHDYLLAGCHDGMVALWKFSASGSPKINDTRPLLCFSADTVPIRSVAWAPSSDMESSNVILTAGHGGLKFWDIRDPFLPLWDIHPAPKFMYSVDWLPEPRCVMISFDDGTMRLLSLVHAACDVPVTGKPYGGTKQQGLHLYNCSSFAIWSVHVSRLTGMVAYCGADGTATCFQLTSKAVDKDFSRNRTPHFACGSFTEEDSTVIVNTPLPNIPLPLKKPNNDCGDGQRSMRAFLTKSTPVKNAKDKKAIVPFSTKQTLALRDGNDPGVESELEETLATLKAKQKQKSKSNDKKEADADQALALRTEEPTKKQKAESGKEAESGIETFPPKIVAIHRVRWNMNKGSERWLCYGGAAGIVRCQEINTPAMSTCKSDREPWNWHGENYGVQKNDDFDASQGAWTQVTLNEEDLSYMFDETTPVKDCGDLSYHVTHNDNMSKESEDKRETALQFKRRRMLQFDTHAADSSLMCDERPSAFLKSRERDNLIEEVLPDASEWVAGFSEDASVSSYDGLDQSCDGWLAEYFNDAEMLLGSDDMNLTGASDVKIDTSEFCHPQLESGADAVQKQATRTLGNVVLKGRKSFIRMPPKVASSVAYPFAFIKPCGFHGDVTLKDINQRIQTPPPSKSKPSNEDLVDAFPTSAFSGKPVVGKTKIRTEGGKGSITIMRTKG
ncbi:hypothetical protein V6N12_016782 [Hibiscus sabdariffa]|uniref:Transducin/WD40 repeat-like superfamily protein n=1 Tax=Hibiscus sabdariffa TaxID=183260 RepID=A0ABR2CF27_9ROSI